MPVRGPRLAERVRDDLTPRQREVMDLLVAETNFQIAEALGLTLEGAKYHVSEILTKLAVDSREEAVAAWRRKQRGFRWPPARVWAPVATGAATAALGLALVLALFAADDGESAEESAAWVAWAGTEQDSPDDRIPLHILRGTASLHEERVLDDLYYRSPHWSPDGKRLAVYGASPNDSSMQLIVFERADWDRKEVTVDYMGALAWSPDGRTLVRLGRDELILYDERLHVRKTVKQAHREQRPIGGLAVWAPDSSKFVAAFQGQLVVASRNGKVTKVDLPHERFATGGGFVGGFGRSFIYWEGSDKFVAISRPDGADVAVGEYERYSFRLQGGRWEAVAIQSGPGFPESSLPGETEPGGGFYQGRTADGSADVFTTMRFNAEQRVTHVWVAGEPEVHFQVIDDGDPIGGLGTWFDIVIVRE